MVRKSKGLSERHEKILEFLRSYSEDMGRPPSIREIGERTGISSVSVVNYYLDQLEKAGYIERNRQESRGIKITSKSYIENSIIVREYPLIKISPKVFISYAHEDLVSAKQIYSFLKQKNISPWLDKINLLPGQDWETQIQSEIEISDYVIICLSKNSITKRGYIQKEIRKALSVLERIPDGAIYIIPVRLDNCDVPIPLMAKQWLDWDKPDAQEKLLKVFDFPNISSRFTHKSTASDFEEPQDYVLLSLREEKTIDEIISYLIFSYDLKPSQAEKIYNECYKKSLTQNN